MDVGKTLRVTRTSAAACALFLLVPACGGDDDSDAAVRADSGALVCPAVPAPIHPPASCDVVLSSPPVTSQNHVPERTAVEYCSNPPSSGDHYPVWADFKEYAAPVEWPYLVHSLEHGAVLLLYKCDPPGCPDVVEGLRKIKDEAPADPRCDPGTKRIIIAPSPTIPTKIAAAAWGKTYEAPCLDAPTLSAFVRDNVGKGTEDLCIPGRSF